MLIVPVGLREIPNGAARPVVASTAKDACACVFIHVFVCPLPNVADQINYPERARSCGMSIDIVRRAKRSSLIWNRHDRTFPLITPRIDPAVAALCGELPFPLMWKPFAGPFCIGASVFLRNPRGRFLRPSLRIRPILPVAQEIQIVLGAVVRCIQKLLILGVGDRIFVYVKGLYLHPMLVKSSRRIFPRILDIDTDIIEALDFDSLQFKHVIAARNLNHSRWNRAGNFRALYWNDLLR